MSGKDDNDAPESGADEGRSRRPRRQISRRSILKGGAIAGVAAGNVGALADLVGALPNIVSTENGQAGAPPSEWQSGYDSEVVGFTPDFSVDPGATVRFKVKTTAASMRIRIYRLGWYNGNGARRVAEITPGVTLPQTQPNPVVDPDTLLVDCGNWATTATWTVPNNAVSGVYQALFECLDTGWTNHCLFVVKSTSASDVLVQTSETTWQAYNTYGGASLYSVTGELPYSGSRATKVSYHRPLDGAAAEHENDFFATEYPLVRWLERNGYDVGYCAGLDVHQNAALVRTPKVYISSGHDEYWSGPQRANVTAARDAGVHLIFFSGNEVFWKTRYEPSIDGTNTADRTLVCYKETLDGAKTDPSPEWTGTWRDPRFSPPSNGGRPENSLTGQLFMCINPVGEPDSPIEVPAAYSQLRFWRNTSIADLAAGETATLTGSTLGYEWDVVADNDQSPPGLIMLSSTTATANQVLVDFGATYVPKSLTHNMSLYKAASGAWVFGAGTVQWSYGLDDQHITDAGVAVDPRMQQATVNLLADMGVQPATLQSGLVAASKSTDTLPPTTTITSPASGSSFPIGSPLTVSGTAVDVGGGQVAAVEVSTDGGASWHPATGTASWSYVFTPAAAGSLEVRVRGIDDSLNVQATPTSRTFVATPRALPAPLFPADALPTTAATDDAAPVEVGTRIRPLIDGFITGVRFFKGSTNTGTHVANVWTSTGTKLATATFSAETATGWQTVTVPSVPVTAGVTYVVSVHMPTGHYAADPGFFNTAYELWPLRGLANGEDGGNGVYLYGAGGFPSNTYGATNYWVDAVFDTNVHVTPTVLETSPDSDLESVAVGTRISATFSESMNASSIVMSVTDAANVAVVGTTAYDVATRTVTFTPSAPLTALNRYTATVTTAQGAAGESMAGPYSWSFTTIGAAGTSPTSLWDTAAVPAGFADETAALELGTTFRTDVDGQVTSLRFYKAPGSPGPHVGHLWDDTGTLLATAAYTSETASGWQQVKLATAVAVQKNRNYVVSYFCPAGVYAASGGYFKSGSTDRGQIHAPASSADGSIRNGVYRYGPSAFPDGSYNGSNYWADVVFASVASTPAPTVTDVVPAYDIIAVAPSAPVRATFDQDVAPASVVFTLKAPGGTTVASTVGYDAATRTATLTPSGALAAGTTYAASVTASGSTGTAMAAPATWSFTTAVPATQTPATLWTTATVPAIVAADDTASVELGVRFTPDRDGLVTGIRFYKGAGNGGNHVGHLWSASGTLLGTATFPHESATGWQQGSLSTAVPVTAGTTYVASYLAPTGRYSCTVGGFAAGVDNAPLHAPSNSSSVPNGLFAYGSGGFPTQSWGASNYYVDVVFWDATGPKVLSSVPANGATSVAASSPLSVTFAEDVRTSDLSFQVRDGGGALVGGSVAYSSGTRTATFTPSGALSAGSSFTATVSASDVQGNPMAVPFTWSFSTAGSGPSSIWPASTVPGVASWNDSGSVELGVRFRSSVAGNVYGVRFYKGAGNTGTHVGHLWSSTGQLLATTTFTGESDTGWQYAAFSSPVAVQPNTTYIASYLAPDGHYAGDGGYFASATTNGPLTALANGTDGGNGVFLYGASGGFPTGTFGATNYWVDVLFGTD
jgi:hypothetical protein